MTHPIRAYRERHGLTQEQAAPMLGMAKQYLSSIEQGNRKTSHKLAREIERITNGEITKEALRPDIYAPEIAA